MPAARGPRHPEVAVERRDVPLRLVAALAGGLAVFLVVALVAIRLIYPAAVSLPSDAPRQATARPRLQIDPAADLAARRAAEAAVLNSYGWVNRARGIVHIPIERAMRDVAAAGIKDWPGDAR
jgi:hypothetical protein